MRFSAIVREALANILSGTSRAIVYFCLALVVCGGLVLADALSVRGLIDEAVRYQQVGASTRTVIAPGRIDGAACEALRRADGVLEAGAVRKRVKEYSLPAVPNSPVPGYDVTPSFPLAPAGPSSGLLISSEVADMLRLAPGDGFAVDADEANVAGVFDYPLDGRRAGFGWSILAVVPERGIFDECWVKVWPENEDLRTQLLQIVLPARGDAKADAPEISQLNQTLGRSFTGRNRFDDRITRFAVPLVFAAGFGAAFLAVRTRRLEVASNMHAGARKRSILIQLTVEMLVWAFPVAVLIWLSGFALAAGIPPDDATHLRWQQGIGAGAFLLGALLGTAASVLSVNETHFFRYFKDRA